MRDWDGILVFGHGLQLTRWWGHLKKWLSSALSRCILHGGYKSTYNWGTTVTMVDVGDATDEITHLRPYNGIV